MRRFWDRRAREDPFYFVDNRLRYGEPSEEGFWSDGERALDTLLDAVGMRVKPEDSVVDIGCGVGRLTRALAARAREVWAIDVSPEMLRLAKNHNGGLTNVHWVLGDGESLAPMDDASADGCVSHVVFQHIPNAEVILAYVREMGRVLKPGGWAAFQVSNDPAVHRRPGISSGLRRALKAGLRRGPRGQADPAWLGTAVDLGELRKAMTESGLEAERTVGEGTQFCLVGARRVVDPS